MNASILTRRSADESLMLHQAFGVLGLVEGLSFLFMSALHAGVGLAALCLPSVRRALHTSHH